MKLLHLRARLPLALLLIAFLVAACTSVQTPNPNVNQDGTLELVLEGAPQADVMVVGASGTVFEGTVSGTMALTLAAGTYQVDGLPAAGMIDPSMVTVNVQPKKSVQALLVYQTAPTPPAMPATSVELTGVRDESGGLPRKAERNANKDVLIYAAQTEEAVCVSVLATDAEGNPVAGAHVAVNVTDNGGLENRVAILRGCALSSDSVGTASFRDSIYTDADGVATFTLYATDGSVGAASDGDVAKVVVAVENGDGTTLLHEFKIVFYNMSHLWASFDEGDAEDTGMRLGRDFGTIINIFDPNDRRYDDPMLRNAFRIQSLLYTKQPQERLPVGRVGYVVYELAEGDADRVHFRGCDENNVAAQTFGPGTCVDSDGVIYVVPNDDVKLEDMPIEVKINATLWVGLRFGNYQYSFPLKDYMVTKRWIGSYLRIDKMVDHHVLTWAGEEGEEHTLDPANAVAENSVFTSTVTLKVTNEGQDDVYDITIADQLPAELGIIESSIDPSGGTYDSINHAVTWNWQQNQAQIPAFEVLAPGDSIEVTFQVYVRQKPGFCVDEEDLAASRFYANQWTFANDSRVVGRDGQVYEACYTDPYEIINGAALHDVTASWFSGAPSGQGGFQAVVDFNGWVYQDQVIIYAVRPYFDIDKVLRNYADLPLEVGMDGVFDIWIKNVDRPIYNGLAAMFPEEFDGTVRDNPYGNQVTVADLFLIGLDFDNATPLTLSDDDGVQPDQSFAANFVGAPPAPFIDLGDKAVVWSTIPLMGGGDEGHATLTLDNNLPGIHINIAALIAYNLNQFDLGDCLGDNEHRVGIEGPIDLPGISIIADCAYTFVLAPTDPWLELSSLGNFELFSATETATRGEQFPYIFAVTNAGNGTALGTMMTVELDNDNATIDCGASFSNGPGVASCSASSITFATYDHPAGVQVVFVVVADANKVGNNTATATVDYMASINDTQYPLLPLTLTESVSIKPPF